MEKLLFSIIQTRQTHMNLSFYMVKYVLVCLIASSCTSWKPVTDTPDKVLPHVVTQSRVQILLKSGERIDKLKVSAIDSFAIVGRQDKATRTILIDSIQFIEKNYDKDGKKRRMIILKPGDVIQVTYPDGHKLNKLRVVAMDDDGITVSQRSPKTESDKTMILLRSDIRAVKVRVPDAAKTVSLIAIPVMAVVIILLFPSPTYKINLAGK